MLLLLKSKLIFSLLRRMEPEVSTRKLLEKNKKLLDDLIKRRFVFFQGFEIYGGTAGLYDFGPVGSAIRTNIEQFWRQHFILEEEMLEISTTCLTPSIVFQNSGHVARFADLLVKDVKGGFSYRADKLLAQWLQKQLKKGKLSKQDKLQYEQLLVGVDNLSKQQMAQVFQKYQIKSPDSGNDLSPPQEFNLMFKTQIGPSTNYVAYLRPETAQGIFVNFNKLLQFNGGRLPFAGAQIGLGFRNQIAPRNGLVRVRQFQMAEIEHFLDPQNKNHPKFKSVAHIKLPLYSADNQVNLKPLEWMAIGEAVERKIVNNQTLGYFMVRIFLFLRDLGLNAEQHLRFRQHMKDQMAHYACDCWDAQAQLSSGWLEIVGCADRSAYDLTHHAMGSGVKLVAARKFKQPRPQKQTIIAYTRQVIGKQFKKNAQLVYKYLDELSEENKAALKEKFDTEGQIQIPVQGQKAVLNKTHLQFQQKIVNVMEQKFTPSVIQPSFGIGRIMLAMLEHTFKARDQKRTYLCLKPRIAPVKVSILPLQGDARFDGIIADLKKALKRNLLSCKVDDTGQSIGRRYARTDEIGIPFGITVDFKTLEDETVTLRELHTMKQLRVPLKEVAKVLAGLSSEEESWEEVCKRYPFFESGQKDE